MVNGGNEVEPVHLIHGGVQDGKVPSFFFRWSIVSIPIKAYTQIWILGRNSLTCGCCALDDI